MPRIFDLATSYGHDSISEISNIAKSLGHDVYDVLGFEATPTNFFVGMESFQPELVFAMGHGDPDEFAGQNNEIVMKACTNDQVMNGSQAMMLSCLMGQELAPSMVSKGARTVAAYISEFTWIVHPDYADRPSMDPYWFPFRRAIVEPARLLLSGGGWRDWYDQTASLYRQGINEWWNNADPYAGPIVSALRHDLNSLIVLGEFTRVAASMGSVQASILLPFVVGLGLLSLSFKRW